MIIGSALSMRPLQRSWLEVKLGEVPHGLCTDPLVAAPPVGIKKRLIHKSKWSRRHRGLYLQPRCGSLADIHPAAANQRAGLGRRPDGDPALGLRGRQGPSRPSGTARGGGRAARRLIRTGDALMMTSLQRLGSPPPPRHLHIANPRRGPSEGPFSFCFKGVQRGHPTFGDWRFGQNWSLNALRLFPSALHQNRDGFKR
jgi:hypothetical protein